MNFCSDNFQLDKHFVLANIGQMETQGRQTLEIPPVISVQSVSYSFT